MDRNAGYRPTNLIVLFVVGSFIGGSIRHGHREKEEMRQPARTYKTLWIGCLLTALCCATAFGASSGTITGVSVDPSEKNLVITCEGKVGKRQVRVIGNPNRLVVDFNGMKIGKAPRKLKTRGKSIYEVRVGPFKGRARVVADFRSNAVPAFKLVEEKNGVRVVFGRSVPASVQARGRKESPLSPKLMPAAANPTGVNLKPSAAKGKKSLRLKEVKLAQSLRVGRSGSGSGVGRAAQTTGVPGGGALRGSGKKAAARIPSTSTPRGRNGRMVREVRPPVTPPTPDTAAASRYRSPGTAGPRRWHRRRPGR